MNQYRDIAHFIVAACLMLLIGLSSAYAVAIESAGKIIAADGKVTALNYSGVTRAIKRGDNFYVEDTILTGEKSTVSLAFTDGTLLELKEQSAYKIKNYQYKENAPKDDSYIAELVKGGFRSITGAIGKRTPEHYEVKARMTTLTVRGTKLMMQFTPATGNEASCHTEKLADGTQQSNAAMPTCMDVQVGVIEGAVVVASAGHEEEVKANTSLTVNTAGVMVHSDSIPPAMMEGYSNKDINTLINQAQTAGVKNTPQDTTTFIEGEGSAKQPLPLGGSGSTPCDRVSSMAASMP